MAVVRGRIKMKFGIPRMKDLDPFHPIKENGVPHEVEISPSIYTSNENFAEEARSHLGGDEKP